jgi:hypothetical protein
MTTIYFDIETVPDQRPGARDEIAATIKPPGTLKKTESIAEWERESKPGAVDEAWLRTSLDGTYGQVVAISFAIDDADPVGLMAEDLSETSEADLVRAFMRAMSAAGSVSYSTRPLVVGHNVIGFDLQFLWRRCVIRSVKPPLWWPRAPKPWSEHVTDTMLLWAGDRGTIGMDRLARALGFAGKTTTGADVWPMVQAGRFADVSAYCSDDVALTREIHRRLTFAGVV